MFSQCANFILIHALQQFYIFKIRLTGSFSRVPLDGTGTPGRFRVAEADDWDLRAGGKASGQIQQRMTSDWGQT